MATDLSVLLYVREGGRGVVHIEPLILPFDIQHAHPVSVMVLIQERYTSSVITNSETKSTVLPIISDGPRLDFSGIETPG